MTFKHPSFFDVAWAATAMPTNIVSADIVSYGSYVLVNGERGGTGWRQCWHQTRYLGIWAEDSFQEYGTGTISPYNFDYGWSWGTLCECLAGGWEFSGSWVDDKNWSAIMAYDTFQEYGTGRVRSGTFAGGWEFSGSWTDGTL